MDTNGSLEYALTWKEKDMPWGPPICLLRASARRTSASDFSGWPTPVANDDNKSPDAHLAMKARMGGNRTAVTSLQVMAKMAGWPTPQAEADAKQAVSERGGSLTATLVGWPTPAARDGEHGGRRVHDGKRGAGLKESLTGWATPRVSTNGGNGNPARAADGRARLEDQVQGWPTPSARDWRSEQGPGHEARMAQTRGKPLSRQVVGWVTPTAKDGERGSAPPRPHDAGVPLSQQVAQTGKRGALNPEFSRWLMGFPPEWASYAPTATR